MGPQVDRILDRGVAYWLSYRKRHGFHGVHITCAGRPLDNTGIRSLANAMPYTWVWPWGDAQHGQTPAGGLMGSVALRYYDDLERLLGHLGPDRIGFGAGFDLHEWVAGGDHDQAVVLMARWVETMLDRFPGCMIGGRALVSDGPWPGTYAGFEHQVNDKLRFSVTLDAAIAAAGRVPTFTEDRFRDRGSSGAKHWTQLQMLELGMPVCLEQRVAAIWAVLRPGGDDDGSVDFDDPEAVRELLEGDEPPSPPPGDECMPAAAYAAELRGIEERLQREVIEPIEREYTPSSWRGWLLAVTGITKYFSVVEVLGIEANSVLEEMETCTPPSSGGNGGGNGGNGNGGNGAGDPPGVPGLDEITAVFPGTRDVLSWGIVPTRFKRIWTNGERVFATWDELGTRDWPYFQIGDEPEALGVIWLVWKAGGRFIASSSERLRRQRERTLTEFGFDHITGDGLELPGEGDLVGAFLAGPSRHIGRSKPEYEHRGAIEWFVWDSNGELERFVGTA